MKIETIIVGRLETNCFVVSDEETGEACVIDPGDEPEKISAYIACLKRWLPTAGPTNSTLSTLS